jgi:hypothetical protein
VQLLTPAEIPRESFEQISSAAGDPNTQISPISGREQRATIQSWGASYGACGKAGEATSRPPEILGGYRSPSAVREPRLGEVFRLPDGSGPWRVVDWAVADRVDSPGNVLIVQPAAGEAA